MFILRFFGFHRTKALLGKKHCGTHGRKQKHTEDFEKHEVTRAALSYIKESLGSDCHRTANRCSIKGDRGADEGKAHETGMIAPA